MKVAVLLRAASSPGSEVSVTVDARVSEKFSFVGPAMGGGRNVSSLLSPENPNVTWEAIEAACISGGYYARHLLGVKNVAIQILTVNLKGDVGNVIPFAIATRIAVCASITERFEVADNEWEGWRVDAVERINANSAET